MQRNDPWVIVLAAGSGTRLGSLTIGEDGIVVPKQYCSLRGGRSLLLDTIDRALQLTTRERIVVVVAANQERWWRPQLGCLDPRNVIVQPTNRGTAAGILLPLAHVIARDVHARVAVLPSDHHADDPTVLTESMRTALSCVEQHRRKLVMLGITPDSPDTEYGWILPDGVERALQGVNAFVEKPPLERATELLQAGAVWNSFLFAAKATFLWELAARHAPEAAAAIAAAVVGPCENYRRSLQFAYTDLPCVDFSSGVLGRSPSELLLLRVPRCGWTDLGTPARVVACVADLERRGAPHRAMWYSTVDLANVARSGRLLATA